MKVKRDAQISEINITPLTDIFLVLLIIMMIVTPVIDFSGLNLDINTVGRGSASDTDTRPLTIEVSAEDAYRVADEEVNLGGLVEAIRAKLSEFPDGLVIKTNPDASHEAMARALGAAYQAGVTKVAVIGTADSQQEGKAQDKPAETP